MEGRFPDLERDLHILNGASTLMEAVKDFERDLIVKALNRAGGSVTKASELLGISWQQLGYLLDNKHQDLRHRPKVKRA